jgi:hypothetical protein
MAARGRFPGENSETARQPARIRFEIVPKEHNLENCVGKKMAGSGRLLSVVGANPLFWDRGLCFVNDNEPKVERSQRSA